MEAYIARNMFEKDVNLIKDLELNTVEISDGSIKMEHNKKCEYINQLANQNITVLSEVGYKSSIKFRTIKMDRTNGKGIRSGLMESHCRSTRKW